MSKIDYQTLSAMLDVAKPADLYDAIVSAPFENKIEMVLLFLGFICLYIVDEKTDEVCLKAASGTEQYHLAVEKMKFNLEDYHLKFDKNKDNTIVKAITLNEPQSTTDWATLNRGKTPVETVRLNQANSGIAYTVIHPLPGKVRGGVMYNYYQYPEKLGSEQETFMKRYTKIVSKYLSERS